MNLPPEIRTDAEAILRDLNWAGRRMELILANIRDLRLGHLAVDLGHAATEVDVIGRHITHLQERVFDLPPETRCRS